MKLVEDCIENILRNSNIYRHDKSLCPSFRGTNNCSF